MEEWQIVLLTSGISVVSSIVTVLITLSRTHRNEVKKLVWEKRSEVYFDLYNTVEELLINRYKIYDKDYTNRILQFKPKMKLLASPKTVKAFKEIFELIAKHYNAFNAYCTGNDPKTNPKNYHTTTDESGVEHEIWHGTKFEIDCYEIDVEKFKKRNCPSRELLSQKSTALYEQMRKDLGSNIK